MKAISLWQPWASLFLSPDKVHETRSWEFRYRGWIAIHAAKRTEPNGLSDDFLSIVRARFGLNWRATLPRGAVIGAARIVDCISTEQAAVGPVDWHCGDYSPGRFAIKRAEFLALEEPIPFRGHQKYFDVPDGIAEPLINAITSRLDYRVPMGYWL
jgi:hypothetical protein